MMTATYVSPVAEPISILRGIDPAQVEESPSGTVYLIHLDRPFRIGGFTFSHYIGWSSRGHLARRMIEHRTGSRGSRFLRAARAAGCTWHLARTWPGDLREERRVKNMGGASRFCPSCGIIPLAERQLLRDGTGRYVTPESRKR